MRRGGRWGWAFFLLFLYSLALQSAPMSCGGDNGGSTSCASGPASQSPPVPGTGAGNPIDVVTGNKYQRETDLAPLPGELGLELLRHYNSQGHYHGIFGHGWSHSYEARLHQEGAEAYVLRQADGRIIRYSAATEGRYRAPLPSDGWLTREPSGDIAWHWPNGQRLLFDRSGYLRHIDSPSGQHLSL